MIKKYFFYSPFSNKKIYSLEDNNAYKEIFCNLIMVIKMKNRYKKSREVAIKDINKKIHELNEKDWKKFKKSLRDNFLIVLGLQEMMQSMLIQASQGIRR